MSNLEGCGDSFLQEEEQAKLPALLLCKSNVFPKLSIPKLRSKPTVGSYCVCPEVLGATGMENNLSTLARVLLFYCAMNNEISFLTQTTAVELKGK